MEAMHRPRHGQQAAAPVLPMAEAREKYEAEQAVLSLAEAREFQQAVEDFRTSVRAPADGPWTVPVSPPPVQKIPPSAITAEFPVVSFGGTNEDSYAHR